MNLESKEALIFNKKKERVSSNDLLNDQSGSLLQSNKLTSTIDPYVFVEDTTISSITSTTGDEKEKLTAIKVYGKHDKKNIYLIGYENINEWRKFFVTNSLETKDYATCLKCDVLQREEKNK